MGDVGSPSRTRTYSWRSTSSQVAIDLALLPHYGTEGAEPDQLRRGEARAGTTRPPDLRQLLVGGACRPASGSGSRYV